MYTQKCYIEKTNDESLYKELKKLGYCYMETDVVEPVYLVAEQKDNTARSEFYLTDMKPGTGFIDCGLDAELFLALASLNDDSFNMFQTVTKSDCYGRYKAGETKPYLNLSSVIHPSCYRDATVDEIFRFFKEKKQK